VCLTIREAVSWRLIVIDGCEWLRKSIATEVGTNKECIDPHEVASDKGEAESPPEIFEDGEARAEIT